MKHFPRAFEAALKQRLSRPPGFIQVVLGPRQVGKTSGVLNALEGAFKQKDYNYFSCEEALSDPEWFLQKVQVTLEGQKKIIVFDEIQKIEKWSELVKLAWDKQKREKKLIHWVLLGSSSLQLSQGLGESLAGRYEVIPVHHWSAHESMKAFGLKLNEYIAYGGYPASYPLISEPKRMKDYLMNSVFEAVVGRDILRHVSIRKPALFRQTFMLACQYPAQEISYNKLLGQLQEAGNVDQIKHYLDLFDQAFLLRLIFKKSKSAASRTSSPKLLPAAPAFSSLFSEQELGPEDRGRVFEAIVGNRLCEHFNKVYYWREGTKEIDFVVMLDKETIGIEVKSKSKKISGAQAFRTYFKNARVCYINLDNYLQFEKDPLKFIDAYAQ